MLNLNFSGVSKNSKAETSLFGDVDSNFVKFRFFIICTQALLKIQDKP